MFNESNTVESMIRDLLCGAQPAAAKAVAELPVPYIPSGLAHRGAGWHYVPAEPCRASRRMSLSRPLCARRHPAQPGHRRAARARRRGDYKLRAIVLGVRSDGLVSANEEFTARLRGERSMPFWPEPRTRHGAAGRFRGREPESVRRHHAVHFPRRRPSAAPISILLVNGFPLVLVEAKTPVRNAVSWVDGALQVHNDYERFVPELFACNVFSVATEGKDLRYGSIDMPVELWGPWREERKFTSPARRRGTWDV